MRFLALVEDGDGKRRHVAVRAADEAAARASLEKRGLVVREVRKVEGHPPPPAGRGSEAEAEPAAGRGPGIPERPAQLLASLDRVLEECDEKAPPAPPSTSIRILMREGPDVIAATVGILAKDVCRRISRGRSRSQCADFLVTACAMPRGLATSVVGMAADAGRAAVAVAQGKCTEEEAVRTIVDGARGAEERVVRALIDRIVPLVRSLDGKRFLDEIDRSG